MNKIRILLTISALLTIANAAQAVTLNDIQAYAAVFETEDLFGDKSIEAQLELWSNNAVTGGLAADTVTKENVKKNISRNNGEMMTIIKAARAAVGTSLSDNEILKWKNDLGQVNILVVPTSPKLTGLSGAIAGIIKKAALKAEKQIGVYRNTHWKSQSAQTTAQQSPTTSASRQRAQRRTPPAPTPAPQVVGHRSPKATQKPSLPTIGAGRGQGTVKKIQLGAVKK